MGIEINNTTNKTVIDPGSVASKKTENNAKADSSETKVSSTNPTDSVKLTDSSIKLNELESSINSGPESDKQRIDAIKKAIASGDYAIDAKSIALKLSQLESQLP